MSKVFKRRRSRSTDPREWNKKSAPFTLFNVEDDDNNNNNNQKVTKYTPKLIKFNKYNKTRLNNDNKKNDITTTTANTTATSPIIYDLFGFSLKKQPNQQSPKVKQFRRRRKVEIIVNPNGDVEEQVRVPYGMSKYLKKHQIEGVRFMWKHIVERKQGCVIAHSMGLGKSIQTVTFVTTLLDTMAKNTQLGPTLDRFKSKRILLLAPLTTLSNWVSEFDKWRPPECQDTGGNIYNYAATTDASASRRLGYLRHWYNDGGILLMSYEQFRSSVLKEGNDPLLRTMLVDPGPSLLIADEAHRIKNSQSQLTLAIQQIQTRARICLTGSPIQNNLSEFYCVVDFACPDYLPNEQEFKYMYTRPIQNVFTDSSSSDIYLAKKQLFKLQLLTSDIMLRCDATVLTKDLPKKTEYYIACKLTHLQYKGYVALLELLKSYENPMINLCVLRAMCNHPSIFYQMTLDRQTTKEKHKTIGRQEDSDTLFDEEMMEIDPAIIKNAEFLHLAQKLFDFHEAEDATSVEYSSKMAVIVAIATECRNMDDKLIIVSHSILCLDYLEALFEKLQFNTVRIDGSTFPSERQPIIERFGNDDTQDIMLLSSRAGSLGVNITSANRMILCDSDWNPQHDEQSVGRVYRYGQIKNVFIYRLYTYTTMEHKLLYQSIHKRGLASRVVDNEKLLPQDKREMKKYYAIPEEPTTKIDNDNSNLLSNIPLEERDTLLRNIIQQKEQSVNIQSVVIKDALDHGDRMLQPSEMELETNDIEKAKREVKGYLKTYYINRQNNIKI